MDLNIQLVRQNDFLKTSPSGELDLSSTKALMKALAKSGGIEGRPMLVDVRNTSSVLNKTDVFELASNLLDYGKTFRRKTAILCRPDDSFERANFFELVANNRGYAVNAFTSFEEAIMWLAQIEPMDG